MFGGELLEQLAHAAFFVVGEQATGLGLAAFPRHPLVEKVGGIRRGTVAHGDNLRPMAGYSGTPLPKKLGIKEGHVVALVDAPGGFDATLGQLPDGVAVKRTVPKATDVVVVFVKERAALAKALGKYERSIFPDGALWMAWPKKASKVPTDITEDVVREECLPRGLVDVKVCAIDETWSGLKLVWRKELRT